MSAQLAALATAHEPVRPYFPALAELLLFIGMWSLPVQHRDGWPLALAIGRGVATDLERLAISITLRAWRNDVPTIWHARGLARLQA